MTDDAALDQPGKGLVRNLLAPDNVAAAVMGWIGAAGHPAGLLSGLEPIVARVQTLVAAEYQANKQRAAAMWRVAEHEAGRPVAELIDVAASDEDRRFLATSAAAGAEGSRYPARIIAIGKDLAEGLITESLDAVLAEQQIIGAMSALDRHHVVLLRCMALGLPPSGEQLVEHEASEEALCRSLPGVREPFRRLVAVLEREGLAVYRPATNADQSLSEGMRRMAVLPGTQRQRSERWVATDFGLTVLRKFRAAAFEGL